VGVSIGKCCKGRIRTGILILTRTLRTGRGSVVCCGSPTTCATPLQSSVPFRRSNNILPEYHHHPPLDHDPLRLAGSNFQLTRTRVPRCGNIARGCYFTTPVSQDDPPERLVSLRHQRSLHRRGVVGEYPAVLDGQTTTSRPITVVAQVMAIVKARREGWPLGQRRKPPLAAALYAPHFAVPSLFPPVEPGSILRANRRSVVLNDPPLANHPDPIYCASALHGGIYAFETPDNLSGIPGEASHIQSIPYTRRWRGYFDSGRTIQAKKKN